jgi:hypothetical protein
MPARRRTFEQERRNTDRATQNGRMATMIGMDEGELDEEEAAYRAQIAPDGNARARANAIRSSGQSEATFDEDLVPFDPRLLLRSGKITDAQFVELVRAPTRAPNAPLPKITIDVTVGDLRSGLIDPVASKEVALAKHRAAAAQAVALLDGTNVGPLGFEPMGALTALAESHHQRAEQLAHPEAPQLDVDEDPGYEFLQVVRHVKKNWHPGFAISEARKQATAQQGRSVQQSKILITLVLHRRATWDEPHNNHVMRQMSGACTALLSDAGREHLRRVVRLGMFWGGSTDKGWQTWAPAKAGAATTGVGHCIDGELEFSKAEYLAALELNREANTKVDMFWNARKDCAFSLADLQEGPDKHPYVSAIKGPIFLADEYASDLFDDVVLSCNSQVGIEVGPVARLFHFHMLLDFKHLSKLAVDKRAFIAYFLACWQGSLFKSPGAEFGDYCIRDQSGYEFVQPWERPYLDIKLLAEDSANIVAEAYVKKQAIGFMNAARHAEAAGKPATILHGRATLSQPMLPSAIGGQTEDRLRSIPRSQELYHQPVGTAISSRGHVRSAITGTLMAPPPVDAVGLTAAERRNRDYHEAVRQAGILSNNVVLVAQGLMPAATAAAAAAAEAARFARVAAEGYTFLYFSKKKNRTDR